MTPDRAPIDAVVSSAQRALATGRARVDRVPPDGLVVQRTHPAVGRPGVHVGVAAAREVVVVAHHHGRGRGGAPIAPGVRRHVRQDIDPGRWPRDRWWPAGRRRQDLGRVTVHLHTHHRLAHVPRGRHDPHYLSVSPPSCEHRSHKHKQQHGLPCPALTGHYWDSWWAATSQLPDPRPHSHSLLPSRDRPVGTACS